MSDALKQWQQDNKHEIQPPNHALPTFGLFFAALFMFFTSIWLALNHQIPLVVACLINAITQFMMFTVIHDSSHRSVSQHGFINEALGYMATWILSPFAGIRVFRFIHMQHHRFTNEGIDVDPDQWAGKGRGIGRIFFWMTLDIYYLYWYAQHWLSRPKKERQELIITLIIRGLMITGIICLGYGKALLWLYFIPGRIALAWLAFAFDFLPHYPHDTKASENKFRATNIHPTLSWLMTPILLAQNYHLVHHLYPRVPFYRYKTIWQLAKKPLIDSGARVVGWDGKELVDHK